MKRVAIVGGGPGGLFFGALFKRAKPDVDVVLFERNLAEDAFGFGVVFSDRTLELIDAADPVLRDALHDDGVRWDAIAVRVAAQEFSFAGNGMSAIHRRVLLRRLQGLAADAGVELRFGADVSLGELDEFDVVVAADGANSRIREQLGERLGTEVAPATAKFIWFATPQPFGGLTFLHRESEHGRFAAHAYPIGSGLSTFIVETDEPTWMASGLAGWDPATPPGPSDTVAQRQLERVFADDLNGLGLVGNNSRWGNFRTRTTRTWHDGRVVLLGDAIHTAHFSVGSGTKMAMEDALSLARHLADDAVPDALDAYQAERTPEVERIQKAARSSLSWWEHFGFYADHLDPLQFAFHFFSRSIDLERIRRRDPALAAAVDAAWIERHGTAPLDTALRVGPRILADRRLVFDADANELSDSTGSTLGAGDGLIVVEAPTDELAASAYRPPAAAAVVTVYGGTPVTRTLVAERARLGYGVTAVLVDDDPDPAAATTTILAGRADAVARRTR